jgi:hypothetical protein
MGLNLSIRRIIFSTLTKFDGTESRPLNSAVSPPAILISLFLTSQEVKQIAGRAGRYGSQYEKGEVTVLHSHDRQFLSHNLNSSDDQLTKAFLFPTREQLELLGAFIDTAATPEDLLEYWKDIFLTVYGPSEGLTHFSTVVHNNTSPVVTASVGAAPAADKLIAMAHIYTTTFVLRYFDSIQVFATDLEIFLEDRRRHGLGRRIVSERELERRHGEDQRGPRVPLDVLFGVFKECAIQGLDPDPLSLFLLPSHVLLISSSQRRGVYIVSLS